MKKTIRINISGLIFNIDEDAYEKLQQYLSSITKKFLNTEEGNEIIADVEARIAELFHERIGDRKEVVNLPDVEHVIEIMGMPEDFEDEEDEETSYTEPQSKRADRRIYRDPENRVLSGLASGIGAYFGVDPVVIRVIFVLMALFYGTSILIYILLWIIIPEAKTRSQKLEMRGQDINLSNIETSIKKEFNNVKSNFNNWQKSRNYDKIRTNIGDILNMFGKVFLLLAKVVLILFGISFLISGIALLGTMTGLFFFSDTFLSPFNWNDVPFSLYDFATLFTDGFNARVGMISSYLIILIPVLAVIYLGLKFIFRFKTKNRYIGVFAGAMWLVSIIVLASSAAKVAYGMRSDEEVAQVYKIDQPTTDTLYLNLLTVNGETTWSSDKKRIDNMYIEFDENEQIKLYGQPWLDIQKSNTSDIEMNIHKRAKGSNEKEAVQLAKNIRYDWQQNDSVINFERYFRMEGDKKIRNQSLDIVLKIPVGKVVFIGNNMDEITSYIDNIQDLSDFEMTGKFWVMTENGLSLASESNKMKSETTTDEMKSNSENKEKINAEIEAMKSELDSM